MWRPTAADLPPLPPLPEASCAKLLAALNVYTRPPPPTPILQAALCANGVSEQTIALLPRSGCAATLLAALASLSDAPIPPSRQPAHHARTQTQRRKHSLRTRSRTHRSNATPSPACREPFGTIARCAQLTCLLAYRFDRFSRSAAVGRRCSAATAEVRTAARQTCGPVVSIVAYRCHSAVRAALQAALALSRTAHAPPARAPPKVSQSADFDHNSALPGLPVGPA